MQAALNFINNRRYQDAINVLNRMNDRTAQWYYASSMANAGVGNNVLARDYAAQDNVNMEPNNRSTETDEPAELGSTEI